MIMHYYLYSIAAAARVEEARLRCKLAEERHYFYEAVATVIPQQQGGGGSCASQQDYHCHC
ncbi:hypothetical protein [Neomoorella mulderi]|uniref:Uncharacterized protein n=1 Tax=Moorella mulderi DSM 14980 TaxID=1122241 RepID=A0A151AWN5_9FIRM|nr:hypothetical protein [Moorella mulderi]KYH32079.1 hypothetical protein MOMUL_16540 [Moorella mulderi DSM 14980]